MENLKIWKSVLLLHLYIFGTLAKGNSSKVTQDTNLTAYSQNPVSTTQDAFTEYRSEYFDLNSSVTLNCSNKTWASIIFITWMIDIDGKQCQMAHSDNDSKHDTCNDGKILRNNTNGETYLYIPHFTKRDEGRYQCETVYNGGSSKVVINVSAKGKKIFPQQISTRLDLDHREAVCSAAGVKSNVSISWKNVWNTTVTSSSVPNPDGSYTMESRLKLPDHVNGTELQCIVTHPSWTENYTETLQLPSGTFEPWHWIIISLALVCFLMGIFFGLYILRKHLSKIRNCCKFSLSASPPQTTVKPQDVEDVEPYASYVQRINSIYNSSADLLNV
ncbi:cell surface glycoprotein CD200 receptor 1-A-like isoform X3 [Brienomyrus brachyistius]|uniref:cell surface glycoprotein CD200 receptor 1-A-like isoform X3 n=1 Tax=Brienomyrus brachyistius TaxID=42636 RepID=UPI0020B1A7D7|nr:cell surface glycoprotein CD200 receptor 1-A-like isoform X3 [Brienomyrus brachyistius]